MLFGRTNQSINIGERYVFSFFPGKGAALLNRRRLPVILLEHSEQGKL